MGNTPEAIPNRMQRGEPVDVVIMAGQALDGLIKQGKVVADSRTDLARSGIAMAVRAGAPKPDISSVKPSKNASESEIDRHFRQRQRRLPQERIVSAASESPTR